MTGGTVRSRDWMRGSLVLLAVLVTSYVLVRGCAVEQPIRADPAALGRDTPSSLDATPESIESADAAEHTPTRASAQQAAGMQEAYFIEVLDAQAQPVRDAVVVGEAAIAPRVLGAAGESPDLLVLHGAAPVAGRDVFADLIDAGFRFRVSAPGFSDAIDHFQRGHATPKRPHRLQLSRPCSLEVTVVDERARPVAGSEIVVTYDAVDLVRSDKYREPTDPSHEADEMEPVWRYASDIGKELRKQLTDARGTCRFEGLPANVSLQLFVYRDGRLAYAWRSLTWLEPGEHAQRRIVAASSVSVALRFVQADGEPIREQRVVLQRAQSSSLFEYLSSSADTPFASSSDREGHVQFDRVPIGSYFAGLERESKQGDVEPPASIGVRIEIAAGRDGAIDVVIPDPLYVTGTVATSDGSPLGFATVLVESAFASGAVLTTVTERGEFRAGPLVNGELELQASDLERGLESVPVSTVAGRSGVALVLRAPKRMNVRLITQYGAKCRLSRIDVESDEGIAEAQRVDRLGECAYAFDNLCTNPRAVIVSCDDRRLGVEHVPPFGFNPRQPIDVHLLAAGEVSVHNTGTTRCAVELRCRDVRVAGFELDAGMSRTKTVLAGELVLVVNSDGIEHRRTERVAKEGITYLKVP